MAALLLFAVLLTQLIENAAVAIILAPVAFQIGKETGSIPSVPGWAGHLRLGSVLHAGGARKHDSGDGAGALPVQALPASGPRVLAFLTWLIASLVTPLVWPFGGSDSGSQRSGGCGIPE